MEDWLAEGRLSQAEFDLMVMLVGRYVVWDLDQFDHWQMPDETGSYYVDFTTDPDHEVRYRRVWPTATAGEQAWTVWRHDDNGVRALVAAFGNAQAANAHASYYEGQGHKQTYWVQGPEPSDHG